MTVTKQLKINKLFRKGITRVPVEHDELETEIQQLTARLREKQTELFNLQRNKCRRNASPSKKKSESFIRPQRIILNNSVETLKRNLQLMSMLSGVEVQSYEANDHCCVVFHMQHESKHEVKHGLRIEMKSGINEISKSSLPLGFNLNAVLEDFDNIMMPDCLTAIRKALVAYYDRLEQYEVLKNLVSVEAQLFKIIDGSHMEISFLAKSDMEEDDEQVGVVLMLDYRVYDIRPKTFSLREIVLPEGAAETLSEQCAIFKRKPLSKAFKKAFMVGDGPYKLVHQIGVRPTQWQSRKQKRFKPNKQNYNNDDTFHPEDCSDHSDDEV